VSKKGLKRPPEKQRCGRCSSTDLKHYIAGIYWCRSCGGVYKPDPLPIGIMVCPVSSPDPNASPITVLTVSQPYTPIMPDPGPSPELPYSPSDLVTLDQAAGKVHRSKRTLERYKTKGTMPAPAVEGGGGRPDLWEWKTLGPWLEQTFGIKQPDRFPGKRES